MTKKKKIILSVAIFIVLALVISGIVIAVSSSGKESGKLKITLIPNIPEAYIGETYDVAEIIQQESGVKYSISACYQNYYEMKEYEVETDGLTFCPEEEFDICVEILAYKGNEKAKKIINVPVTYQADPIDELLESNGTLGWADTGIVKTLTRDETYLKSEDSHTALEVNFRGSDMHDFGTAIFSLANFRLVDLWSDQTWNNAVLTFWVYNPMPEDFEFQLRVHDSQTGLVDVDWTNDDNAYRQIAKAGEWTQICFSMHKYGITRPLTTTEDLTIEDALNIKIQYAGRADWQSLENLYEYQLFIDGIDVVDASNFPDLDTEMESTNETVDQGWENMPLDTGWQGVVTKYNYHEMQGEGSTCSLQADFSGSESLEKPFMVLSPEAALASEAISQLPNMNGGTLQAYFKFENMTPEVSVDIYRSVNDAWLNSNVCPMELEEIGNGWYKAALDVSNISFDSVDNDEIIRIRFNFTGANKNSRVYIDTIKFESKNVKRVFEDAKKDWINLALDTGQTNVTFNRVQDHLKAEGSVLAAKVNAPANEVGRLWFSPENSVLSNSIAELPDMSKGVLHAWFYFGDQTPVASVRLYNDQWGGSREVAFSFEDKGNGWYYGSISNTLFNGYDKGDSSQIIRIEIIIPESYAVYIDGLMSYPNEKFEFDVNYADLFDCANITVHSANYEIVTDTTNKSKEALHMWAESGAGYPTIECSYIMPIDLSAYSNVTFDVKSNNDAYRWVGIRLVSQDKNGNLVQSQDLGYDYTSKGWNKISFRLSSFENVDLTNIVRIDIVVNCDDALKKGKTAHYYFDNLAVIVTDPPLTPSNSKAKKHDADLIAGEFTEAGTIKDVSGIMKVSEDNTGELSGKSALLIWANEQSGWPSAQFMFSKSKNWSKKKILYIDTKFVNAHNWFSVELIGYNKKNKLVYSDAVGVDTCNCSWNTSAIDLSKFEGIDMSKIYGIRITVNMQDKLVKGKLAQAYIDNVYLDTDSDLLGTSAITYSGANSSMLVQRKKVNKGTSAIKVTTVAKDGWPSVYVPLDSTIDLSKMESMSIDMKISNAHPWFAIELYNKKGTKVAEIGKDISSDKWQTSTIQLSDFTSDKKILANAVGMRIVLNLEDNLKENSEILLDNLTLKAKVYDPLEEKEEASGDILSSAKLAWGPAFTDNDNYVYTNKCTDVNGTLSGYSWKFSGNAKADGWAIAQLRLDGKVYDLSKLKMQFDVKFECAGKQPKQWIGISLQDSNWQEIVADYGMDIDGDGWQTVTISPKDWTLLSGQKLSDVNLIKFVFDFDTNKGREQAVYIDNLKFVQK